jgi:hypothetical protein
VLRRKSPTRLAFGNVDRLVFAGLYRVAPGVLHVYLDSAGFVTGEILHVDGGQAAGHHTI